MWLKGKVSVSFLLMFSLILRAEEEPEKRIRQYQEVMWLGNIRSGSANPVSISFAPLESLFGLKVGYGRINGVFRKLDDAAKKKDLQVNLFGMRKLKKIVFEGNLEYETQAQHDRKWNSTLFISPQNPFVLADSIAGKYNLEKFMLTGSFSLEVSSRLKAGLRAAYQVGSLADQTDPRPDVKSMRFSLNPGIDFRINDRFSLGISARLGWLSESVKYSSVVGGVNHLFFLFNGMGNFYPNAGTAYERRYKGERYAGDLQFVWEGKNGWSNFLEGGTEYSAEDAIDGGAQKKFKGGKYKNKQHHLTDRFQIKTGNKVHNIILRAQMQQVKGIWYEQKDVIDENGSTYWEVVSSAVKHKEDRFSGNTGYRLDWLRQGVPVWTFEAAGGYLYSEVKNYPEVQTQTYHVVNGSVRLTRYLNIKKVLLGIYAQGGIDQSGNATLYATGIKLEGIYTRPLFDYLTADHWKAGGGMQLKIPLQFQDFHAYLGGFARYSVCQYAGREDIFKNTNRNRIDFGVDFTF